MEKYEIAVQALRDIVDPIGAARRALKEDERLNGQYAYLMSNDANYLKSIAEKALNELGEPE